MDEGTLRSAIADTLDAKGINTDSEGLADELVQAVYHSMKDEKIPIDKIDSKLAAYFQLFPKMNFSNDIEDPLIALKTAIYKSLHTEELSLFPSIFEQDQQGVEMIWISAAYTRTSP